MKTIIKRSFVVFLVLILSAMPLLGVTAGAYTSQAEAAAWELYELGLFSGTGTDEQGQPVFELDRSPTRHEAVTMLVRLLGKVEEAKAQSWTTPFVDVAGWARPYVGYAYTNGLTSGTSSNTYSGEEDVSAAQYLTFVLRALGYKDGADFYWETAWELSDRLGITHGEYNASSGPFTRGDVAIISRNALSAPKKPAETASGFEVHFIDVGQADAALILCGGHAMLVDGGNAADSSLIYSYLKNRGIDYLDYMICTHAHEDHAGGLAGALNYAKVGTAYCPVKQYDTKAFNDFLKYLTNQGVSITVPSPGDTFRLGTATAQIIGPISPSGNPNNTSIVFRIQYGETAFLFAGDAEREEELEIIDAGYTLKSTVLKVGHHGSSTSSSYPFLYYVEPVYGVISVGRNNSYGHPADDTLSRLRDAGVTVYRTDELGTIICRSDGKTVSFTTEKGEAIEMTPPSDDPGSQGVPEGTTYVLNTNTHKFHYPNCSSVAKMSEKNKQFFDGTRAGAIAMGYDPCGICKP